MARQPHHFELTQSIGKPIRDAGTPEIVKLTFTNTCLEQNGTELSVKVIDRTPLKHARDYGHTEIVDLLSKHGEK